MLCGGGAAAALLLNGWLDDREIRILSVELAEANLAIHVETKLKLRVGKGGARRKEQEKDASRGYRVSAQKETVDYKDIYRRLGGGGSRKMVEEHDSD